MFIIVGVVFEGSEAEAIYLSIEELRMISGLTLMRSEEDKDYV